MTAFDDPLVKRSDLAAWARTEIDPADIWATTVIRAASALVRDEAKQPDWTVDTAPVTAKIITAQCAVRAYINPPEGESSSGVGPLSSRLLDAVAEGIYLSADEKARLAQYVPNPSASTGGLWVLTIDADEPVEPVRRDILLPPSQDFGDWLVMGDQPDDDVVYGLREPVTYDENGEVVP